VVAMTRDLETRWSNSDSVHGRGAVVVLLVTPPAPTHTHSHVLANSRKAGSAATDAELKKLQKYQDISKSVNVYLHT